MYSSCKFAEKYSEQRCYLNGTKGLKERSGFVRDIPIVSDYRDLGARTYPIAGLS
jgi:hypothetical protein